MRDLDSPHVGEATEQPEYNVEAARALLRDIKRAIGDELFAKFKESMVALHNASTSSAEAELREVRKLVRFFDELGKRSPGLRDSLLRRFAAMQSRRRRSAVEREAGL